jgi:hypothetical protein
LDGGFTRHLSSDDFRVGLTRLKVSGAIRLLFISVGEVLLGFLKSVT